MISYCVIDLRRWKVFKNDSRIRKWLWEIDYHYQSMDMHIEKLNQFESSIQRMHRNPCIFPCFAIRIILLFLQYFNLD